MMNLLRRTGHYVYWNFDFASVAVRLLLHCWRYFEMLFLLPYVLLYAYMAPVRHPYWSREVYILLIFWNNIF